jgi:hypothetical protein
MRLAVRERDDNHIHGTKRTRHHAGLTANASLRVNLHAILDFCYGPVWATLLAGGIFTVVTGHCTVTLPLFKHRNTGNKLALSQNMLLVIMPHYARHFARVTANTVFIVSHNKTIHKGTRSVSINLIFYKNIVFTDPVGLRQCSFAQNGALMTTNL